MSKIKDINIADHLIGQNHKPFIIAEMSGNHNQSLQRALGIVEAAASAGAHALKLQTYTADTMTLNINKNEFKIKDKNSLWYGKSLYELYELASMPWEWQAEIFKKCAELGLIGFSTPFDESAVDFLEELKVPAYKIASFENHDLPLIEKVANTGKPIIISSGMASIAELEESIKVIRATGNDQIVLLKCTSSYPSSPEHSNIRTIPHMQDHFKVQTGLSDHTIGSGAALAAIALGAVVIEKHFTLSRSEGGVDSAFSIEPDEMKNLVVESVQAWQALGQISYGVSEEESSSLQFSRSLYICQDMKAGDIFNAKNLRSIRPGFGLPPKYLNKTIGKKVKCDVSIGTPLSWDIIE